MLKHLIQKEILDHILSLRFVLLAVAGSLIVWLSLFSGYQYYRYRLHDYQAARAGTEERIRQIENAEKMDFGDPFLETTSVSYLHHRIPTALCIFVRGLDPVLGRSVHNRTSNAFRFKYSPASTDPLLGVFLPLDLGIVVQVVLSLFALLLCYDAICGEKEAGTLRLLSSYSVSRSSLVVAKLIGSLIPAWVAFGLPVLLGVGVILMLPDVALSGPELGRLATVLLAYMILISVFACLGLASSTLTHRSTTSLVCLLAVWVGFVLFVPSASLIAADAIRPAPSPHEFLAERGRLDAESGSRRNERWNRWREENGGQDGPNAWWSKPETLEEGLRYQMLSWGEARQTLEPDYVALRRDFENRYAGRFVFGRMLARFSPVFAVRNAVIRMAGVGWEAQERFVRAYRRFKEGEDAWFVNAKMMLYLQWSFPEKYGEKKYDVSDMPRFLYHRAWPIDEIASVTLDIGLSALWGVGLLAVALVGAVRYDVR